MGIDRTAADDDVDEGAGHAHPRVALGAGGESADDDLEAGGALVVADEAIGHPQRPPVEGARSRDTEGGAAGAAEILHGGEGAGVEDAEGRPGRGGG